MPKRKSSKMEATQIELIQKAKLLGLRVDPLEDSLTDHILITNGKKEILFNTDGVPLDQLNYQAFEIAANKQLCKRYFQQLQLPHPKSIIFQDVERSKTKLADFMQAGQSYVCKPLDGTEGKGVCMNISSLKALKTAWQDWNSQYRDFMLEEQKAGEDLRLQAIGGRLVAACRRQPASVIGDGQQSLAQLIQAKQLAVQAQNPANKLELDKASYELLSKQGLQLDSIPQKGQIVQLKYVANMNQGAMAIDITDSLHPDYANWIERLAAQLQLRIFALDILCLDYQAPPTAQNSWALEINATPYWYHHTFSEVKQHDIATLILKDCFEL
jgi:cyanophycin synthetase